jgi:hypothetical protein
VQIRKSSDYRVSLVANLIESLKDNKYHITPFEIAENVVKLMDEIRGIEYANKINHYKEDYKAFIGKV